MFWRPACRTCQPPSGKLEIDVDLEFGSAFPDQWRHQEDEQHQKVHTSTSFSLQLRGFNNGEMRTLLAQWLGPDLVNYPSGG